MTVLPAACASYTTAAISSGEKPVAPGSSFGERTPPEVMILIWSAPARRTSRVTRRMLSIPSTTPIGRSGSITDTLTPDGMSESPCPPVCESGVTAIRMRGPGKRPRSTAILTPRVVNPASRTVVKPASSVSRACTRAIAVFRLGGMSSRCWMLSCPGTRWTWQSINPGSTARSPVSMTSAPFGGSFAMLWMTPSSMTMNRPLTGSAPVPSIRVVARTATVMRSPPRASGGLRSRSARSSRGRTAP